MRNVSFRALTALLLTSVGLLASACTVYEGGPRYGRGAWGIHDDGGRDHHQHRDWR